MKKQEQEGSRSVVYLHMTRTYISSTFVSLLCLSQQYFMHVHVLHVTLVVRLLVFRQYFGGVDFYFFFSSFLASFLSSFFSSLPCQGGGGGGGEGGRDGCGRGVEGEELVLMYIFAYFVRISFSLCLRVYTLPPTSTYTHKNTQHTHAHTPWRPSYHLSCPPSFRLSCPWFLCCRSQHPSVQSCC